MRFSQIVKAVSLAQEAGVSVILQGPPGVGKTDMFKQMAKQQGRGCLIVKLPQYEPVELKGLPKYHDDGVSCFFTKGPILQKAEELYKEYGKGPVVVADEIGNASGALQTASYALFHELTLGGWDLPPGTFVGGTTNRGMDKAYTHLLAAPLVNRVIMLDLEPTLDDWIEWAISAKVHPFVTAFLRFRQGDLLFNFEPKKFTDSSYAYATPRAWENVSKVVTASGGDTNHLVIEMIAGMVGKGPAAEFSGFVKCFEQVPSKDEVLDNPKEAKLPKEPSGKYAVAAAIVGWMKNAKEAEAALPYIDRLPKEFQVMIIKDLSRTQQGLVISPGYTKWMQKNGASLA